MAAAPIFQSTSPCGEQLAGAFVKPPLTAISIHIPVWGATRSAFKIKLPRLISIHIPVWGATVSPDVLWDCVRISIHIPVWGATYYRYFCHLFQSTSPCGEQQAERVATPEPTPFQSTSPCGEQPAGRMGRDAEGVISIHIPVWGATEAPPQSAPAAPISIHIPVWGATTLTWNKSA